MTRPITLQWRRLTCSFLFLKITGKCVNQFIGSYILGLVLMFAPFKVMVWHNGSTLVSVNIVVICWAWLVLRWVTVLGFESCLHHLHGQAGGEYAVTPRVALVPYPWFSSVRAVSYGNRDRCHTMGQCSSESTLLYCVQEMPKCNVGLFLEHEAFRQTMQKLQKTKNQKCSWCLEVFDSGGQ